MSSVLLTGRLWSSMSSLICCKVDSAFRMEAILIDLDLNLTYRTVQYCYGVIKYICFIGSKQKGCGSGWTPIRIQIRIRIHQFSSIRTHKVIESGSTIELLGKIFFS
jgi:hypothetical protein